MQKLKDLTLELININRIVKNQGQIFEQLTNAEKTHNRWIWNSVESQTFWRDIWGESKEHQNDAEWLKVIKKELEHDEDQYKIDITKDRIMRVFKKIPKWRVAGSDNVQGSCLKGLTPLHEKLLVYL